MFINAQPDECRIAVVADGAMTELYTERASRLSRVGNIYKSRITNVEASIQAAFVDFGTEKNGFLHISDVHPRYFPGEDNRPEAVGRKRARKERPPIQQCLRRGQEVIVQVTKEGVGTKGSTLTTYLSIPGRYLVCMPSMHRLGVSRKIEDEGARVKARALLQELNPPPEMGFIVRTAGLDRPKQDLQRDLSYLVRLWKSVDARAKQAKAPAELYQESDLVIRTIRDVYNSDIKRIVCDDETVACKVKEFLQLILPRSAGRVELYEGHIALFHAFALEQELEEINSPRVPLPSGGSIVIDQTEALVAIDVNSGRFRDTDNAETTALRINTEAVREVTRQLRLRDLGGVIVIDFIDMMAEKNRRRIEKLLRDEVKTDRARTKILRMSRFGIIEMTRQRIHPSLVSNIFRPCPTCMGMGRVKSAESQALTAMRTLRLAANDERVARIELTVCTKVADHINNTLRADIATIEQQGSTRILIHGDPALPTDQMRIVCTDGRSSAIQWDIAEALKQHPPQVPCREITKEDLDTFHEHREAEAPPQPEPLEEEPPQAAGPRKKKRRRRRKGGARPEAEAQAAAPAEAHPETPGEPPAEAEVQTKAEEVVEPRAQPEPAEAAPATAKKKRSRRRRKKPAADATKPEEAKPQGPTPAGAEAPPRAEAEPAAGEKPTKKKRRRSRRKPAAQAQEGAKAAAEPDLAKPDPGEPDAAAAAAKKKTSRRRRRKPAAKTDAAAEPAKETPPDSHVGGAEA